MTTSVPSHETHEKLPALSVVSIKPTALAANAKTFNLTSSFNNDFNLINSEVKSNASVSILDDLLPISKGKHNLFDNKQLSFAQTELLRRLKDLKILSTPDTGISRVKQNYEKSFKLDRDYQFGARNDKRCLRTVFTDIELESKFKLSDLFQIDAEINSLRIDLSLASHSQLNGITSEQRQATDVKVSLKMFRLLPKLNKRLRKRVCQVKELAKIMENKSTVPLPKIESPRHQARHHHTTTTAKLQSKSSNFQETSYLSMATSLTGSTTTTKKSSKKTSFDPYLKYEYKSTLTNTPGFFGQITLVSTRQDPLLAMKKIPLNIPDEKEIFQKLQKKLSATCQPDYELQRLKTLEYERIVKLSRAFLNHSLKNSSLIKLIDAFTCRELTDSYFVMDYYPDINSNLKTRLSHHRKIGIGISMEIIKKWFEQTCSGLKYLHEHDILHANLKPNNFLLDTLNNIKLTDFGYLALFDSVLSRAVNPAKSVANRIEYIRNLICKLEAADENYLPIETNEFYEYTTLSETYCVGAIFFELMTYERYHWSKFDIVKLELNKKYGFKYENLVYLLSSTLNSNWKQRPPSAMMLTFSEWEKCVEVQSSLKESLHSVTDLCTWRSASKTTRKLVRKRLKVTKVKLEEIAALLPRLQNIKKGSHLNILPIYGHLFIDCKLEILSEYLPGGNLAQRIQRQIEMHKGEHFTEELILKWILEISNGLSYLHSKNIIHGNLKCENILFSCLSTLKLVDFGLHPELSPDDPDLYSYSPEQRTQSPATAKSDIYMLGACIYKCLTLKSMRKEIDPEVVLGKKFISSANLILGRSAGAENIDVQRIEKKTKSAVDLKLKLFANEYSTVLKKNLLFMLSEMPTSRPKLKTVLGNLKILSTGVDVYKLASIVPIVYTFSNKIRSVHCRDADKTLPFDFLVSTSRFSLPNIYRRDILTGYTLRINNTTVQKPTNKTNSINRTIIDTSNVFKKVSHSTETKNLEIMAADDALPLHTCIIDHNYALGCDSDCIYLFNEQLKTLRVMSLIDALETTRDLATCKAPPPRQTTKNNSLNSVNQNRELKLNLNLNTNAICYDFSSKKLYLLITVQCQHCFLNIFDIDLRVQGQSKYEFAIFFDKKYHMPSVRHDMVIRMLCNQQNLFICERDKSLRAFSKDNGNFAFKIEMNMNDETLPVVSTTNKSSPILCSNSSFKSEVVVQSYTDIQDFFIDSFGNIYAAFETSIKAFNKKSELIWCHEFDVIRTDSLFSNDMKVLGGGGNGENKPCQNINKPNCIQGKIRRIGVSKTGALLCVTEDERDANKSRCYFFT